MNQIKYNAPWHDLRRVCVGSTYAPAFYEPIRDVSVRESLQQIARETEEDYVNLIRTLENFGVKVTRPRIDPQLTILDFIDDQGKISYGSAQSFTLIPRPPMQPRDSCLIVGDRVLATNPEYQSVLGVDDLDLCINPWNQQDRFRLAPGQFFDAPLATVVGDIIIVDCQEHTWLADYFRRAFPDRRIRPVYIGGHNDAVYSVIKPGVLISTHHYSKYADTFPGWTVKQIEDQSWNAIPGWRYIKHGNRDRWWVPENLHNAGFAQFINDWLGNWVGFVAETVFDVNLLQINSSTVLVNNYNQEMFDFLDQQGIEPIIVPFRHRFFWDGGLHCVTNDLYREGEAECYVT